MVLERVVEVSVVVVLHVVEVELVLDVLLWLSHPCFPLFKAMLKAF